MMSFLAGYSAFLHLSYWTNPYPVPLGPSLAGGIFAFFSWFIVAGIALWVLAAWLKRRNRLKREVVRRFASPLFWTGVLGLLCLFCAYEQVAVFGMRLWFLFDFVYFVIGVVRAVIYALRDYPRERKRLADKENFEKWLPKKS